MITFAKYIGVGVVANLIGLAAFQILIIFGAAPELATFLAFFPAFATAYILNRGWSFQSSAPRIASLVRYFWATVFVVAAQVAIVSILVRGYDFVPFLSQFLALCTATPVSFLLLKYWVFATRNPDVLNT